MKMVRHNGTRVLWNKRMKTGADADDHNECFTEDRLEEEETQTEE